MGVEAKPLWDRFWPKVEVRGDCWWWTSAVIKGYGVVWVNESQRAARAHRVAYELLVGPIPEGLTIDHLCQNKLCVNPDHFDLCTAGENASRSPLAPYNVKARQTHCKRGHAFTPENTRFARSGRSRCCIQCQKERDLGR